MVHGHVLLLHRGSPDTRCVRQSVRFPVTHIHPLGVWFLRRQYQNHQSRRRVRYLDCLDRVLRRVQPVVQQAGHVLHIACVQVPED